VDSNDDFTIGHVLYKTFSPNSKNNTNLPKDQEKQSPRIEVKRTTKTKGYFSFLAQSNQELQQEHLRLTLSFFGECSHRTQTNIPPQQGTQENIRKNRSASATTRTFEKDSDMLSYAIEVVKSGGSSVRPLRKSMQVVDKNKSSDMNELSSVNSTLKSSSKSSPTEETQRSSGSSTSDKRTVLQDPTASAFSDAKTTTTTTTTTVATTVTTTTTTTVQENITKVIKDNVQDTKKEQQQQISNDSKSTNSTKLDADSDTTGSDSD
jgi:hypothetical protein